VDSLAARFGDDVVRPASTVSRRDRMLDFRNT
jgi:hypothetical protein